MRTFFTLVVCQPMEVQVFSKTEESDLDGLNYYAIGKISSERYCRLFSSNGLKTTILRLFNVYGRQNLKNMSQGMISIYLAQALYNKKVVVKGSLDVPVILYH